MFPKRTADTMSEAIAVSSPSGRMSKRAKAAFDKRLHERLFGKNPTREDFTGKAKPDSKKDGLLRYAKTLRDLADRGMSTRKFNKEAEKIEQQAALLPEGE